MKKYFKKVVVTFLTLLGIISCISISAFAEDLKETIKINNTILEFEKVLYVDGTNGNDTVGLGSKEKPYQTIAKAQSVANDNYAIYIKEGVYDYSNNFLGLYEEKHKLTFIGEPNKTKIISNGNKHSNRDHHIAGFRTNCSVYDIIFEYTAGNNRTSNYSTAIVGSGQMVYNQYGNFYNCVFISNDVGPSPAYANGNCYINYNNCSFLIPNEFKSVYCAYGSNNTKFTNCAVSKNVYSGSKTSLGNVQFSSEDYSIVSDGWKNIGTGVNPDGSQANVGVYGGEFAWGDVSSEQSTDPEYIINTAFAKGDNTNNASGEISIKFNGTPETRLNVVKTANVKEVWVGDNFTYTITVTNTGSKTAKKVIINDEAPEHINFKASEITVNKGNIDSNSTEKKIIVNIDDILPEETVVIKIPVTVI